MTEKEQRCKKCKTKMKKKSNTRYQYQCNCHKTENPKSIEEGYFIIRMR